MKLMRGDACPVKIDIPEVLVHLRAKAVEATRAHRTRPTAERPAMKSSSTFLSSPRIFSAAQKTARLGARLLARRGVIGRLPGPGHRWSDARDTPVPPAQSFRSWWTREHGKDTR